MSFHINRLVIAGVGLIGGSLAAALKQAVVVDEIVGIGRRRETLEQARQLGLIDVIGESAEVTGTADLVVLAMPVAQTASVLASVKPYLHDKSVVTDVGSTKSDVIATARQILGNRFARFVPGHPIAGAEKNGPQAARTDLFQGRNIVLCPEPDTDQDAVTTVDTLWKSTGANVLSMPAPQHDRIFAAVSHLPHLAAFALVDDLAGRDEAADYFRFAASGFRDFTRIAGSSPEMWRDIALANREALLVELSAYMNKLGEIASALDKSDAAALESIFKRASEARRKWEMEKK